MTWSRDSLRAELYTLFAQHAQSGSPMTETSHLVADLGIDSLGIMELIADIEDKFNLHIPDDALREVNTVGDVAHAIETRLQSEGRLEG